MKVVLFCGGLGTRMREYSETIPKPLVDVGTRPLIWHVMKYYDHFGHRDFVMCLGYRGESIKEYFLRYDEGVSNDFTMRRGGRDIEYVSRDIDEWTVHFADTGTHSNIGERLGRIRHLVEGEPIFLANYTDGLSDLPLDAHVEAFRRSNAVAAFVAVRPSLSMSNVVVDPDGRVQSIRYLNESTVWINGGFFVFRPEIFDYMKPGEELVEAPFQRLIEAGRLLAYRYEGFWGAIDTFKDKTRFDELVQRGRPPWMIWNRERHGRPTGPCSD